MKARFSMLTAGLVAMFALTACKPESSQLLVSYATMKVIERGQTAEEQYERAQKINEIATDAKALLAGETVTVSSMEHIVRAQIAKLHLSPSDAFLADALIQQVVLELQQRVGSGVLESGKRYKVSQVLDWVIQATAYGGSFNTVGLGGAAAAGG